MSECTFTFFFENEETGTRTERNICKSQATQDRLALLFKLAPESIYIVEDYGEYLSEFPSASGTFTILQSADPGSFFKVEGEIQQPLQQSSGRVGNLHNNNNNNGLLMNPGAFRRSSLPISSRKRSLELHALKIQLANVNNRRIGDATRQNYFMINESTSNVESITEMVREYFQDRELVLVQKDLLKYEDSEAAQSLAFWKNTSRKVFAVKESLLRHRVSNPANQSVIPSDTSLNRVITSLQELHDKVDRSNPLFSMCKNILKCLVCQGLASGEVAIGGCCKQFIGCRSCLETWFRNHRTCPHCRSNDGLDSIVYVGFLGELINKLNILNSQENSNAH